MYEIEHRVSAGGMGVVFKGRAIETREAVAIKILRDEMAETTAAPALFRREASALRDLYDEAVVRYYAFAVDPALGVTYLAMEFVEGPSLAELIREGAMPYDLVDILRKRLARGLGAAHRLGIVHRDISPDNIILPGSDPSRSKIIDFGIARQASGGTTIIGSGYAGKTGYMSPEQVGLFPEVTARSDVYSLGLVLAEALAGRPIDMGGNPVEIVERRRGVPDLGRVTPMTPLLQRMLQPNPTLRTASMADVAAWLPPTAPVPTSTSRRASRPVRANAGRRRLAFAAASTLLACGAAAILLVPRLMGPVGPTPPPASTAGAAPPDLREAALPPAVALPPSASEPGPAPPETAPSERQGRAPAPGSGFPAAAVSSDLVRAAQIELARVGCYAGSADGVLDAATRTGFETFARANSLTWSGDVQAAAIEFLKAAPAGVCAAPSPPAMSRDATTRIPIGQTPAPDRAGPDRRICRELSEQAQLGDLSPADQGRLRAACR